MPLTFLGAQARLSRTHACRSNHERALFGKRPDSVRIELSKRVPFATLLCSKLDKNVAGPTERSAKARLLLGRPNWHEF